MTFNNDIDPPIFVSTDQSTPYSLYGKWTDGQDLSNPTSLKPCLAPLSGAYRRSAVIVDIEVVNSTTFQIQAWFLDMDLARLSLSDSQFSSLVQQPDALSLDGVLLQNGGSVNITSGTPYGTLDAINICWNDTDQGSSSLLLHSVAAVKLQ